MFLAMEDRVTVYPELIFGRPITEETLRLPEEPLTKDFGVRVAQSFRVRASSFLGHPVTGKLHR